MKKNSTGNRTSVQKIVKAFCFLVSLLISQHFVAQNVVVSGALFGNGTYPDLNSAFIAINGGVQTAANISVSIVASTTETQSAVLNAGAWATLSVTPSGGATHTITGNISGALIDLNGADNVLIDGLNSGGNALIISNTSTLNTSISTIRYINGASSNTLTNCSILGSAKSTTLGTVLFATSSGSGNNDNIISNSNIGPVGNELPFNCLLSLGTSTAVNSFNTVQNCNIYDFFSQGTSSSGIFISSNNTGWNVTGNKIYQTALRTYTSANTHKAIQINSGNANTVSNNVIGYSSSSATGIMAMTGTVSTRFVAIELSVASLTVSSVQGNTISAITLTTSSGTSSGFGIICGINVLGGSVDVGTIAGNLIGGTSGTDLITGFPSSTQGAVVGINAGTSGSISIQNNYIGGCSSTGTTAAVAGGFLGINVSSGAALLSIINNTVGNPTPDNIRVGTATLTTGSSILSGINIVSSATGTATINGNIIRNCSSYGTGTSGTCRGIYASAGNVYSVNNNTVTNMLTNNGNTNQGTGQIASLGIGITAGNNTHVISNNIINNISNTNTFTTAVTVAGISIANSVNTRVFNNQIYDLSNTGVSTTTTAPSQVYGVFIRGGTGTITLNNNMISLGTGQTFNTAFSGICFDGGGGNPIILQIYYNTINITGSVTSGDQSTFGFYRGGFGGFGVACPVDIRNNIITNIRTGGTGSHFAVANNFGFTASATGWGINASNNNVLNATASTVGWWAGSQTFSGWKTASASDTNSYSGIAVTYVNASNDLHLNMGVTPTFIESGAQVISAITTDIDSQTRPGPSGSVNGGGLLPDIGADEIDAVILDLSPPSITYTALPSSCSVLDKTITATITDLTGVVVSGSLQPRVYFRKNAGAYVSDQGVLASGSATNGVWNFTISASALGGLSANDVVSYFLIAQDAVTLTPNITSNPVAGLVATDVNTITTFPTSPNTYTVTGILNGVYTVGSAGTFTSLTAAANIYNISCLGGPVTFSLTDALYSTSETFPIIFLNNPDASSTNSLLIIPAAGVAVGITPTATNVSSAIKFLNARFITIDGLNTGGSSMVVNNSNTTTVSSNIWLASTPSVGPGNKNIGIRNLTLNGGNRLFSNGIIACVDGAAPSVTGGIDNDDVTIQGNSFINLFNGIGAVGSASLTSGGLDNWIVANNLFGPATSGTNNLAGSGILVANALNLSVTNNAIRNILTTSSGIGGINLNSGVSLATISQNTINAISSSASSSGINSINGIFMGSNVITTTVSSNYIFSIYNTNTSGYGARGIIINTGNTSSNLFIRNNMISDVTCLNDASAIYWAIGIAVEGTSGAVNIDYNSVNLFGSNTGLTSATAAAPLYVNSTGGNIAVRNNIFSNTYDNPNSTTEIAYGIYSNVPSTNFSSINHNNYYVGGAASSLVLGYLGANQANLAGIQTAFGGNLNSTNVQPVFVTNTDLHMQPVTGNLALENLGTPIAGITVDIDNQARSLSTPDMGADEFTIPVCTAASGGTLTAASATACAGQTLVANSTGFSTGLTTTYLWKVASTAGGPYSPVTGGTGSTTTSYTSAALPAGVYYVVLETTCANASLTAVSNEGTLTVYAIPTATAASSTTLICSSNNLNFSGTSNIGTSYFWSGPNSFTSTSQNPTISNAQFNASGAYSLIASANGCASTMAVVSATVNAVPSALTVTPLSASICSGDSQTLTVTGGNIPATLNFTPQTNQNATTAYPAPYSAYYGGQKMQFLILASELTAAGLSAGPLNSIQFPVVSRGSNWGTSITSNQNFQVSIKSTALTSVAGTFETGLTIVAASTNFTPNVGYNNVHNFTTPFIWNGTSNLIIETVFSNNFSGTTSDAIVQYNSPTSFQSTMVYRADNQTFATIAAATNTNGAGTNLVRPDFKLNGTGIGTFNWTPAIGLSSTNGPTVSASPAVSTIYSVNVSNSNCSSSGTVNVGVTPLPTLSIVPSSSVVCVGSQATLTASGATTFTWNSGSTATTEVVSPLTTSVYTVSNLTLPCPVVTQTVSIVANQLPLVTAVASATNVCIGKSTVLTANGAATYTWVSGPLTQSFTVNPVTNTTYSVTGTDNNGCSNQATISIVTSTVPVLTVSPASATVCASTPATFTASGATTYTWSSGSVSATETVTPSSNSTYTVTGLNTSGCSTSQTVTVIANALPIVTVSPASSTICVNESLLLTAGGASSYSWTTGATNSSTVIVTPSLTTTYTVEGVGTNSCKNKTSIIVTVDPCTGLREQNSFSGNVSLYPNPSTGLITATFSSEGLREIKVLNSLGGLVMKVLTEQNSVTFDLSGYAKGVYFVNVKTNGTVANYKVVLQ